MDASPRTPGASCETRYPMARILLTSRLPDDALSPIVGHELVMPSSGVPLTTDEVADLARDVDAIVCQLTDRITEAVLACASRLAVVATVSVGYDNLDVEAATRAGVAVCNTPGVLDDTTADLAFALILAASRLLSDSEQDKNLRYVIITRSQNSLVMLDSKSIVW